jgi:cytochrome c biogenesis protein
MDLPGGEGRFQVLEVYKNFREMLGPAALIAVQPTEGEELRFLVFKDYALLHERFPPQMLKAPILNPSAFKPYTFQLEGVETKYYTGLQVNRDPGVAFVWTGCFLMVVGFFITFFTSHRRIWLHASPEEQGMRIRVAGVASKNPVGLERELDHLTRAVRDSLSEKGVVE